MAACVPRQKNAVTSAPTATGRAPAERREQVRTVRRAVAEKSAPTQPPEGSVIAKGTSNMPLLSEFWSRTVKIAL